MTSSTERFTPDSTERALARLTAVREVSFGAGSQADVERHPVELPLEVLAEAALARLSEPRHLAEVAVSAKAIVGLSLDAVLKSVVFLTLGLFALYRLKVSQSVNDLIDRIKQRRLK